MLTWVIPARHESGCAPIHSATLAAVCPSMVSHQPVELAAYTAKDYTRPFATGSVSASRWAGSGRASTTPPPSRSSPRSSGKCCPETISATLTTPARSSSSGVTSCYNTTRQHSSAKMVSPIDHETTAGLEAEAGEGRPPRSGKSSWTQDGQQEACPFMPTPHHGSRLQWLFKDSSASASSGDTARRPIWRSWVSSATVAQARPVVAQTPSVEDSRFGSGVKYFRGQIRWTRPQGAQVHARCCFVWSSSSHEVEQPRHPTRRGFGMCVAQLDQPS